MPRRADGPGLSLARELAACEQPVVITEAHTKWSRGWMARISRAPARSRWGFARDWVEPADDRRNSAGNGPLVYDLRSLPEGVYEADSVERSGHAHRVYFRVAGGHVVELYLNAEEARGELAAEESGAPKGEAPAYGRGEITVDSGAVLLIDPAYLDALLSPEGAKRLRELVRGARESRQPVHVGAVPEAGPERLCALIASPRGESLAVVEAFRNGGVEVRFAGDGNDDSGGSSHGRHLR